MFRSILMLPKSRSFPDFLNHNHFLRKEDWEHEMKWHHNLVQIAFRNYNSYVYHDTFLKFRLYDELAKVCNRGPRTSSLLDPPSPESGPWPNIFRPKWKIVMQTFLVELVYRFQIWFRRVFKLILARWLLSQSTCESESADQSESDIKVSVWKPISDWFGVSSTWIELCFQISQRKECLHFSRSTSKVTRFSQYSIKWLIL